MFIVVCGEPITLNLIFKVQSYWGETMMFEG